MDEMHVVNVGDTLLIEEAKYKIIKEVERESSEGIIIIESYRYVLIEDEN